MEKGRYQKLKLLYLLEILRDYSDENTYLSVRELTDLLLKNEIVVERKTLYKDLELLQDYGFNIVVEKNGRENIYALVEREFELAEVKMLIDVIQASKFLTAKKSRDLIIKLKKLASKKQAQKIQRQVYSFEENKYINENIYYNVDAIHNAIAENKQINFNYWQWNYKKEMIDRKNGEVYNVSPFALVWNDENYYMVAYDNKKDLIKHYRVDKMRHVVIDENDRVGHENFLKEDISSYSKKIFGMYGGILEKVTLEFKESLIGVVVDRFGKDIIIHRKNDVYQTSVEVMCSRHFLGWIFSLGSDIEIIAPQSVRDLYVKEIEGLLKNYRQYNREFN